MKSIREALDAMMPAFRPVGTQRLFLADTLGRHLAEPLVARRDLPPFDNSAMDGYAVRVADLGGASADSPRVLPVRGESRAGGPMPAALVAGTAMRILTGAVIPEGADAVVVQEDVELRGDGAVFSQEARAGAAIRSRASDVRSGGPLLERGAWMGPGELGLCAGQGLAVVTVFRRPKVAILSTGDELCDIHDAPEPGRIVDSNAYSLAGQVALAGGEPILLPRVGDRLDDVVEALGQGLGCDVVLTCGGVSVGDYDVVKAAFEAVGIEAAFWKVRMKPGKPLTFGTKGRVPVVGLPGNPVSAMVTFETFVRPGLRKMVGDPRPYRVRHSATLEADCRGSSGRTVLARAQLSIREGRLWARPLELQGSGSLPSMVGVDALLVLEEGREAFPAGDMVPALLLRDEMGSEVPPFS
jgi:molybdopterin molybdotransferase